MLHPCQELKHRHKNVPSTFFIDNQAYMVEPTHHWEHLYLCPPCDPEEHSRLNRVWGLMPARSTGAMRKHLNKHHGLAAKHSAAHHAPRLRVCASLCLSNRAAGKPSCLCQSNPWCESTGCLLLPSNHQSVR